MTSITYKTGGGAPIGTLTYGYDADGRRVSVGGSLAQTNLPLAQSFTYNPDNSLKTLGSITVQNDNDGNITCMTTTCPQFSYDARGNLQQAVPNGLTLNYSYDALGRRYKFATGLTTTTYQYDGLNPVDTLFDGYFTTSNLFGIGLDDLFESNDDGTAESFLRDALGSTVALTDSSGNVLDQTTYDPYGNTTDTQPGEASAFEFTGRENDGNSFYNMRGRYYDPQIARFISRDPAGLAGGINMYTYAGDSPTNFTDPTGVTVETGGGFGTPWYGLGSGDSVGAFEWSGLAFLSSQGGLGHDVPAFYDGSQNGGGIEVTLVRFLAPLPYVPDPTNPDSLGPDWVPPSEENPSANYWHPKDKLSLHQIQTTDHRTALIGIFVKEALRASLEFVDRDP